jgi:glycosyltransferase involved in cell wall biosynthesis
LCETAWCVVMPKVSVIIPTYNLSGLVGQAIQSVLGQSVADFELIIVDDGSTDNTCEAIKGFVDKRIKYFYKENGGPASARNFGMLRCCGRLVAFLDADDLWPADYLSVMLGALENSNDYGVAYCALTQIYPDGRQVGAYRAKDCVSGWITKQLFNKTFVWCPATVFRRQVLRDFRWDEALKTASDNDGILRLSLATKFLFVPDTEIIRRVRRDSISVHSFSKNVNCDKIRVMERFYRQYGQRCISDTQARRRLGHIYKETAKRYCNFGAPTAAIYLFKRAIRYNPLNFRAYKGLLNAVIKKAGKDTMPQWRMPEPLDDAVCNNQLKL